MSEWWWVLLGYGVAYGALAGYVVALAGRSIRARRRAEELR